MCAHTNTYHRSGTPQSGTSYNNPTFGDQQHLKEDRVMASKPVD